MTPVLVATLLLAAAGLSIALALPGAPRRVSALAGEAYLLGTGAAAFSLFALSCLGIGWSMPALIATLALIVALATAVAWRRPRPRVEVPQLDAWNLIDLLTLAIVAGHARVAMLAPPVEADYMFIWGTKAKKFLYAGGVDWQFLLSPFHSNLHPSYPIFTPLIYDVHALLGGTWNDRGMALLTTVYGAAALLTVRGMLAADFAKPARAIATAALAPLVLSPYFGLAEGMLVACVVTGLLHLRQAVRAVDPADALRGAVFLGLAGSYKDEGITFVVAAAAAMVASRAFSLLPRLWPAVAILAPWAIVHRLHHAPAGLASTGIVDRVLAHIPEASLVFAVIADHPVGNALFWTGVVAALLLGARRAAGVERFLVVSVITQLVLILAAYLATPWDLRWHVQWSWERVVRQVLPLIGLLAFFAAGDPFRRAVIGFEPEEK